MSRLAPLLLVLLLFELGCSASGNSTRRSRGPITLEQIEASNVSTDAYDLIQSLRPEWLVTRGTVSMTGATSSEIRIYVNDASYGGPGALRAISVTDIQRITKLSPSQATTRFGAGHTQGAIMIRLR